MAQYTQENRLISISTPLADDELLLTSFHGSEYISRLFQFQVEMISYNLNIDPKKLIGEKVTITVQNELERTFNGYVSHFSFGEIKSDNLREYRITVVPWLWFLSKNQNQRIFQNLNTKDIVSKVFDSLGFKDYDFRAQGGSVREYCVQYGESDLNFVSRLLEEEGIAYYFTQKGDKHTLILVDKKNAYEECVEAEVSYSKGNMPGSQITKWEHNHEFRKGEWTLNDYNFMEPSKNLIAETGTRSKFANNDKFEHYEYPGLYDFTAGKSLVDLRADAEEVPMNTVDGASDCSSFYAGGVFKLTKHDTKSEKGEYIITSIHHRAFDTSYFTGNEGQSEYGNNFNCIPAEVHYRPLLTHKKPVMKGPQSALVTGPSGEEIFIDEFGRIKVQFIWDREGKKDENSTCFLRVMQSWAGNGWGASFIPRIGHEVIVSFLDGDPDRPIVTGTVYNGTNKPPYSSKTQSGIKTRSTKGGTSANYNELRFEDKKGSEQVYIHAEKDMATNIENDERIDVGRNRDKTVGNNQSESIGKNKTIDVAENHTESIGKDKTMDVGDNHKENIGKNTTISIGKNMDLTIGKDRQESVGGKHTEDVSKEYGLQAKSISMTADKEIILKTGSAKLIMKSNGDITLSGKNINVKGSGNVVIKGSKVSTN